MLCRSGDGEITRRKRPYQRSLSVVASHGFAADLIEQPPGREPVCVQAFVTEAVDDDATVTPIGYVVFYSAFPLRRGGVAYGWTTCTFPKLRGAAMQERPF